MKSIKKIATLLGIAALFMAPMNTVVTKAATTEITVTVDNKIVSFPDVKPYTDKSNRTLVPIRFVSEELGAKVDWDSKTKKVTVAKEDTILSVVVNSNVININGTNKTMDTKPVSKSSRVFVPLRFISEGLGVKVDWLGSINTVKITTKKEQEDIKETQNIALKPVTAYKNQFVGTAAGEAQSVCISSRNQLPISTGRYTIYDVAYSNGKIVVVSKAEKSTWGAPLLRIADKSGLNRCRQAVSEIKDSEGIVTAEYEITALSDYQIMGENYSKFSLSDIQYVAFTDDRSTDDIILAIAKNELLK